MKKGERATAANFGELLDAGSGPDWDQLHAVVSGTALAPAAEKPPLEMQMHADVAGKTPEQIIQAAVGRRASDKPGYTGPVGRRDAEKSRENSIASIPRDSIRC